MSNLGCPCLCVCVCVCIYLVVVYKGLSYTNVILSLYLYLSSHSFSCCTFFAIITSSFQSNPSIYTSLEKAVLFLSKQITFCSLFFCLLKYLVSPFLINIRFFLSVSSSLFINLYIIIKSPLSLPVLRDSCWPQRLLDAYYIAVPVRDSVMAACG